MSGISRREMLTGSMAAGCGCLMGSVVASSDGAALIGGEQQGEVVFKKPYGGVKRLGEGVYAVVSTPFLSNGKIGDLTTHCNGGLVAGEDGVLAFDAYRTMEGAVWVGEVSMALFGRLPTHVACSHFHFDHIGGIAGFFDKAYVPEIIMTETTYRLALDHYAKVVVPEDGSVYGEHGLEKWGGQFVSPTNIVINEEEGLTVDLGGRVVRLTPMRGHTQSDLIAEVDDPAVTFSGDLVWNGIFPNFMSAIPSLYVRSVEKILERKNAIVIPGHGMDARADSMGMVSYGELQQLIEMEAKRDYKRGQAIDQAVSEFKIPKRLGYWKYFKPNFHEVAFKAWYRELAEK
ncbi:MBL fold metallo-hydrolase [Planctomycetota bacterium]|nr:MBL fold metallo-hydrolase [Planctomycetota bacterium]